MLKVELEALKASASLSTRTTSSTSAYDAYKSASWHHGRVTADGESSSGSTSVRRGALAKAVTERAAVGGRGFVPASDHAGRCGWFALRA
jgi:hypothetical protein